ncbi:dockerin type I domain-containing protein [Aeoliella sp. SH292]|uniref:dockerin type I domain-containing protein n=1 Tax=Aeoliella sp. SH292 TaxID=3454464 RepID=UPI003F9BB77D
MRLVFSGATALLIACSVPAVAATFLDNFDTDTTANYTSTDLLSNNAGTGAVVRVIDGGDSDNLVITNPTHTAGALQTSFMHNTAALAIGETVLLDVNDATHGSLEVTGLIVSRLNPITTSVAPGGGDGRTTADFVTASLRFGTSSFQSERFVAGPSTQVTVTPPDFTQVNGVYVQRITEDNFAFGYVNADASLTMAGQYDNAAFGPGGAFVGVYSDIRSNTYSGTVDNLRINSVAAPFVSIDRQTGQVTLSNASATGAGILGYELKSLTNGSFTQTGWTSVSDNYDKTSAGGAGPLDLNDDWIKLTTTGDAHDLSEYNFSVTPGDAATLTNANAVNLGNVWLRTPLEDVTAKISLADRVISVPVVYTGTKILSGDFNGDGLLTPADYTLFLGGLGSNFTGLSLAEAYLKGDLNGDLKRDLLDFSLFEVAYDTANGAGAFGLIGTVSVPEPSSAVLLVLGAIGLATRRRKALRSLTRRAAMLLGAMVLVAGTASAAPFLDDFSIDSTADYSSRAVLGRQGSVLPTTTVVGGKLQVTSAGSGNFVTQSLILHDTATLGAGERLTVDIDMLGGAFGGSGSEMFGLALSAGFQVGVPLPSSSTTNVDVRDDEFSFLFGGFRNSGGRDVFRSGGYVAVDGTSPAEESIDQGVSASNTDAALANIRKLFIARSATAANEYSLGWIDNLSAPHVVRTLTMDLGANPHIGFFTDTRNASLNQLVDNLQVAASPALQLGLLVDPTTGQMRIENNTEAGVSMDSYQITSALGNLDKNGWTSLFDQNLAGFPAGATPTDPNGWVEAPNAGTGELAEYYLNDEASPSTIAVAGGLNLGSAYNGTGQADDLVFFYHNSATGQVVQGTVAFGTIEGPSVPGDYDGNGLVNAADYSIWKSAFGSNVPVAGDGADGNGDGVVNLADYTVWRDNLGAGSLGALQSTTSVVPEPTTALLLVGGLAVAMMVRAGGRRTHGPLACVLLLLAAASTASAARHLDRDYRLGDDAAEGASAGTNVDLDGFGLATYDSNGVPDEGNYQDIDSIGGDPAYVNVAGRPFANGSVLGIEFDGNDYLARNNDASLSHFGGLGNPRNNPPQNPYDNFANITTRGLQLWARPASSTGARQDLVNDTYQFGVHITATNTWGMTWGSLSNATAGNVTDSTTAVAFGQWTHLMQHSFGTDGAVLYVNGVAVAQSGLDSGRTYTSHAAGANLDLTLGVGLDKASNFFTGTLDDVEVYVAGNNTGVSPVNANITQPGQDWGTFNIATDNEFIAATLAGKDAGDVNLDGLVNSADVTAFVSNWNYVNDLVGAQVGDLVSRMKGDLNFNGRVDIDDALVLHRRLLGLGLGGLELGALQTSTVPEPSSAVALALFGIVALGVRTKWWCV